MAADRYYRLWTNSNWFNYEVRIDRQHKQVIRNLYPRQWGGERTEIRADVELVPVPEGTAIRLDGQTLGYLEPDVAAVWAGVLLRVTASGFIPVVPGRIFGHEYTNESGRQFWGEVYLSLDEPGDALPLNNPPSTPYTFLPKSTIVQVTKEQDHLEALLVILPSTGNGAFIATLHERPAQGRSNPLVEVRIDDACVGQLTPQTSQRYLPLIRHLNGRGLTAACWSDVSGSRLAVEVRINAVKANEAPVEVLDGPPIMLPALIPSTDIPVPEPVPAAAPPQILAEPPEYAVIRFVMAGRYTFVAIRASSIWATSSRYDGNVIEQLMTWQELGPLVDGFDYATATEWVDPRGDHRIRDQGAVICFNLGDRPYTAVNIADDGSWAGDWYTTMTDDTDLWSTPITFREIAETAGPIRVVTEWKHYGV